MMDAYDPVHWQPRCGVQKVLMADKYHCGVSSLAMVTGLSYQEAREAFIRLGLGARRKSKVAFSTVPAELLMAVMAQGLVVEQKSWKGWASFNGLGILGVGDPWNYRKGRWHWVVAFRHPEFGAVVFDPWYELPAFERNAPAGYHWSATAYQPRRPWLQVEQRFPLAP
ncbi:PASTA domain-containing protein [Pseudomonas aeruginosa]|nr:PASTA domain-containing protein [Pseudomonas aeruginosa]